MCQIYVKLHVFSLVLPYPKVRTFSSPNTFISTLNKAKFKLSKKARISIYESQIIEPNAT